jgi:hypothetical protein
MICSGGNVTRIIVIVVVAVFGSAVLLPGCRSAAATLLPSATPSPDLEGTADAVWDATLQAHSRISPFTSEEQHPCIEYTFS